MSKILLIDGSNYLFRAFHGLPDLRTSKGEPTGAMRGFFGMLGKVWAMSRPDMAAIVFDAKGKNFRHEMFPDYKSNRPPMPDDLRVQIGPLQQALRDFGWPVLIVPGVEADDVIATIALDAERRGIASVIATGDKDLAQIVDEKTVLLNTMNNKFYDAEGVREKYGVPPSRIIDYLALMGDKVDNVPGIEKCGPKTAAKWIAAYGDLEGVKAHAAEVKGKIGESLRKGLPFLDQAKALVTIKRDCALPEGSEPEKLRVKRADEKAMASFALRWEMSASTLRAAAPAGIGEGAPEAAAPVSAGTPEMPAEASPAELGEPIDAIPFEVIDTAEGAEALARELASLGGDLPAGLSLAWDGEPRHARIAAMAVALTPRNVRVLRFGGGLGAQAALGILRGWLESPARRVIHDVKSAWHAFRAAGIALGGEPDDTMLMSYVLEAHLRHELPALALRSLKRPIPKRESVLGRGAKAIPASEADPQALANLLAEEAAATRALYAVLMTKLEDDARLAEIYETIERPLLTVLVRMEAAGVAVDAFRLARQSEEMSVRIDDLAKQAYELAGHEFNLSSPRQLAQVLFAELGMPVRKKTSSGTPSTDEEVLTELAADYPLPKIILEHRRLTKLQGTYLDKLPKMVDPADGRVHTTFSQAVAVTGRLASADPNLQNIPVRTEEGRRVREAFVGEDGRRIVSADYSQIELRIMAHLSQDKELLAAFARGEDIHRSTAARVFGKKIEEVTPDERRMAKVINFGLIYGMSAFGLAQNLGIDRHVAAAYIDQYFERYPGVRRYMEQKRMEAREKGFVETAFGRRLWLPDIRSSRKTVQAAAERQAINAPMQGTAADLIKKAMIGVDRWLREEGLASKLILQVHDELILEVPPEEVETVKKGVAAIMAGAGKLSVPLIAEVGAGGSWEEAH